MSLPRPKTPTRHRLESWPIGGRLSSLVLPALCLVAAVVAPALAQPAPTRPATAPAEPASFAAPNYWDPKRRIEKPDISQIRAIRFLTEDDYPPFHFLGSDGQLAGFEIDLARAICDQIKAPCTIQARRWDTLQDSLARGQGDAIIAALRVTPALRERFAFTASYLRTPARFVASQAGGPKTAAVADLKGRRVAVSAGSAHEAYLKAFFGGAITVASADDRAVLDAVRSGAAEAGFVDGIGAAIWLNGDAGRACCRFVGGPFIDSAAFGEGAGIAVRRDNPRLAQALDWALSRVAAEGTYATLYLKYFPIGFY